MIPRLHQDDTLDRREALRIYARRCRALWGAVVLAEMNRVSLELQKLSREGRTAVYNHVLGNLRRWLVSRDGRNCLDMAGIVPSRRAIESIVDVVKSGSLTRADFTRRSDNYTRKPVE